MTTSAGDSPAVARHRVQRALRRFRSATSMTQSEVANRLTWSLSKIQRIELGDVAVSVTDLRALLDLYGVDDPAEVQRLTADTGLSRRERWSTSDAYREHMSNDYRRLLQFEAGATAIRTFQPVLIPGILQTPALADVIISYWSDVLTEQTRQVRYDVRMMRRRQILDRADGPEYHVILEESVIRRQPGGPKIMVEQLEFLLETARMERVRLRIYPFERGCFGPIVGLFTIVELADGGRALYREQYNDDKFSTDPAAVASYEDVFHRLWDESLEEDASERVIFAEVAKLRAELGRP